MAHVPLSRPLSTQAFPQVGGILGVVYFHSYTSEHDWQVTYEADALAAFSAMGADPFFNP